MGRRPLPHIPRARTVPPIRVAWSNGASSKECHEEQQRQAARMQCSLRELRKEMEKLQVVFEEDGASTMEILQDVSTIANDVQKIREKRRRAQSQVSHVSGIPTPSTVAGMSSVASVTSSGPPSPVAAKATPAHQTIHDALLHATVSGRQENHSNGFKG